MLVRHTTRTNHINRKYTGARAAAIRAASLQEASKHKAITRRQLSDEHWSVWSCNSQLRSASNNDVFATFAPLVWSGGDKL